LVLLECCLGLGGWHATLPLSHVDTFDRLPPAQRFILLLADGALHVTRPAADRTQLHRSSFRDLFRGIIHRPREGGSAGGVVVADSLVGRGQSQWPRWREGGSLRVLERWRGWG
jgi:hypothetical protein